jgi:hypothetical protein
MAAGRVISAVGGGSVGLDQSYVVTLESSQRRIDVVELLELAEAIGIDLKGCDHGR